MSMTVHIPLRRLAVRVAAAAALLLGGAAASAPAAAAQQQQQQPRIPMGAMAIFREANAYRLTDAGLAKYTAVARNLSALRRSHPNLEIEAEMEDAQDISDIAAALDRQPLIKSAINRGGMTTREFVLFTFAMASAAMFSEMQNNPNARMQGMPVQANRRNVEFYRANKTRLEALSRQLEFGPGAGHHDH